MEDVRVDYRLHQELKSKAERDNFSDANELVSFLLEDALKRNVKKSNYVPPRPARPALKKGDLCRLSKRAKNKVYYGSKNATYVVIEVGTTISGRYSKWRRREGMVQERRADPSNGYCSIQVAYKQAGKWHKTSFHRKDLRKVNR